MLLPQYVPLPLTITLFGPMLTVTIVVATAVPHTFVTEYEIVLVPEIAPVAMPGAEGRWETIRFVEATDLRHDMNVNIVTLYPGCVIPFAETHVWEHGIYILEGKGVYRLNEDWVEVEAGDFMWLRAFCPQACYAGGPGPFRYLIYRNVNRHMNLRLFGKP